MPRVCKRAMLGVSALALALVVSARAQVGVGDNTSLNLNGTLSFGYTGDYSNLAPSDHGYTPGGNADLSGTVSEHPGEEEHRQCHGESVAERVHQSDPGESADQTVIVQQPGPERRAG